EFATAAELTLFIKFAMIRQPGFGNQAKDLPAVNDGRAVEQAVTGEQRQAGDDETGFVGAGCSNALQGIDGGVEDGFLLEEITKCVAGKAQFRKNNDTGSLLAKLVYKLNLSPGIDLGLADSNYRSRRCATEKTMRIWVVERLAHQKSY
ncbi:MAG TPA: hypothetical protein PKC25_03850, partial [Candidatus Rifleibacterium sp.]|nr:hypothetical protein [Candidatus Rifleibacterium sp.]